MKLTPEETRFLNEVKAMTLAAHLLGPRRHLAAIRRDHLRRLRVLGRNA